MPRYFFHIKSKEIEIPDEDGTVLACAWDAFFHARRLIHQSGKYLQDDDYEEPWAVRICNGDDKSEIIALFPFRRKPADTSLVRRI